MAQGTESPAAYIPMDRRQAMAKGESLAPRTSGATLFADVSGFTPLTEALVRELGPRRGAEELTKSLNTVYGALIAEVHRYGGSVVSFAGDAITCWFDGDDGLRATACALAMQGVMGPFAELETGSGSVVSLAIKAAVTAGTARRFLIGDPTIQILDVMAGSTLDRMAKAEKHAEKDEVLVGPYAMSRMSDKVKVIEWRDDEDTGKQFAVVEGLAGQVEVAPLLRSWAEQELTEEQMRPWILPSIYERLQAGQGRFLAELRPGVALFLNFGGLDFDQDDAADTKLDVYVRWVQNVLARYEAYMLQLITGDKGSYLYVAFGATLAHDDDPIRAVAAAMELRSPPPEFAYITGVRIGVSQGQMRVGAYGGPARRTYGVLGDEVTTAARLMGVAEPGQVLVSKPVADVATRSYVFQDLGSIKLKGKRDPLPVYLPLERRLSSPQRPATIFKSALVGREAELIRMEQVMESAVSGKGQILCLQGVAGVGKSHLAAEFVERAIGRGLRVALGACQSTSQGIAYTPWRQAFRALFGLEGEASQAEDPAALAEQQIAQVEESVRGTNPGWLVRLPLLGDLLGLPIPDNETTAAFDPQLRQESLFALAVEIVQDWADAHPLLLLVEDVHWMDEASLGLTVALGRVVADKPILLTLVQRPPLREGKRLLPDLEELPYYCLVDLDVLSVPGIEALVANRLQGQPSRLVLSLVQAQAHGNPFFIEELVDALRESGRLYSRDDGTWTLSEPMVSALREANCLSKDSPSGEWVVAEDAQLSAANLGIPDSIHGIVLARIDRLPELHKLTVKVASVIGRTFEFDLLTRSHPLHPDPETLLDQLEVLQTREFARIETPRPRLVYLFKHNITQEVVYQTLLRDQQRELHQSVGEALEGLLPEAVERLAYHYGHSDVRDKALLYLGKAAQKTQREYANETALNYYNRALTLEERWQWRKGQLQVLHILGRREDERLGLGVLATTSEAPVFDVAYLWGQYYEAIGDYAQARAAVERAMVACRDCGDVIGHARCLSQLGIIARRQGDYERAKDRYGQGLGLFQDQDTYSDEEAQALAQALNGLGTVHRQLGDFDGARAYYEQALALSRASGDRQREAQALNDLGGIAYYQRDFAEAITCLARALEIRRTIGDRDGEGMSLYDLATSAIGVGDYGEAREHLSNALAIQQAIGNRWEEGSIWNVMGGLYLFLGDLDMAETCLQQGLALSREIGDEEGQVYILANLGTVVRDQGDLEAAEALLNDGLTLAQKQNDKYTSSYFLSHLGITSLQVGRVNQAIERAGEALAMRRELDLRLWTTADLATLAAAHLAAGNQTEALDYVGQALAILDECGGEGPESPQRDYFVCCQVLVAAGQRESSRAALRSAYDLIMARAEKIVDSALRQSFLERVPINRQIGQEAASRGITQ